MLRLRRRNKQPPILGYKGPDDADADQETTPDHVEGSDDVDGDGIPNYLDLDSG